MGLIVNYNHPSRTLLFMATGPFAISGGFLAWAVAGQPRGHFGVLVCLVCAGVMAALGLLLLFGAVRFKIRGNPFDADAKMPTFPQPRRRVVPWIAHHWWLLAALAVIMAALGIVEGPPYLRWDRPIPQACVALAAAAGWWLLGRQARDTD